MLVKPNDVKSDAPWFPFYPADWLSSQAVMLMNYEERGQYLHLLAVCWNDEDCSIPGNDTDMALLCGCHHVSEKVRSKFIPHPYKKDALTNPRLMAERVEQVAFKKSKSRAGAKGARVRWKSKQREKAIDCAIDLPIAKGVANDSPTLTSTHSKPLRPSQPSQRPQVSTDTFEL